MKNMKVKRKIEKNSQKKISFNNKINDLVKKDKIDYSLIPLRRRALEANKQAGQLTEYDLKSPEIVDYAYQALKSIIQGKVLGDVDTIKTKHVLEAVKMVYDRIDPIVKHNMNLSVQSNSFIDRMDKIKLIKSG